MNKHRHWHDTTTISEAVHALRQGKILAGTSDTVLGLIAPLTQQGFESLNHLKGRTDKPYLVLVGSKEQAHYFTDTFKQEPFASLIDAYWPGPLTLIVPAKNTVPSFATSTSHHIAIRLPDHEGLQKIARAMGGIFSTSANRAGQPVSDTITSLDSAIEKEVAFIIVDDEPTKKLPSTIVDCTGNIPKLIREGAYTKDMLHNYLPAIR